VDADSFTGNYQWSPAGDRVLTTINQKEPFQVGFAVIDAQTGIETKHWIDRAAYDCSMCSFTWTRDGKQVILPVADRSNGEGGERVKRLQLFDATTGAPTRTLPVPAAPTGPFSWSPDGRYVIAKPDQMASQLEIIDVATGTGRPFSYTHAVWATNDRLLATDTTTVYTLTPDGTAVATMTVNLGAGDDPITVGPPS
jgi:dipeptidyl aminopeptidase/acylaminoacyl peptidase